MRNASCARSNVTSTTTGMRSPFMRLRGAEDFLAHLPGANQAHIHGSSLPFKFPKAFVYGVHQVLRNTPSAQSGSTITFSASPEAAI